MISRVAVAVPEQGNLVLVRDRYWVVESVRQSSRPPDPMSSNGLTRHHLVRLVPIDDKGSPDPLSVFWETEPGTEVRPQAELPDPKAGVDDADTFAAFLDAARWGAIASADPGSFQSPFRAGIDIEDYQLLPLVEALRMPRVSLLIADDVGLGKTVEAGLIAQELVLRNQAQKILVVCPPSLCQKWQREMREQFGLGFEIVDTDYVHRLRRERGVGVNPFRSHPRLIVSMEWIKFESQMRWFDEFLPPDPNTYPRAFDLLIVDEAHRIAPSAVGNYAKESLHTKTMRRLAPHFEHRLFLTATPHNGFHRYVTPGIHIASRLPDVMSSEVVDAARGCAADGGVQGLSDSQAFGTIKRLDQLNWSPAAVYGVPAVQSSKVTVELASCEKSSRLRNSLPCTSQ